MKYEIKDPTCPKCGHLEYYLLRADDGLKGFQCLKCEHKWTAGFSGGYYILSKGLRRIGIDH